jgi:hypothetical protein
MGSIPSMNNIFLFINKDNVIYSDSWDYSQQIWVGVTPSGQSLNRFLVRNFGFLALIRNSLGLRSDKVQTRNATLAVPPAKKIPSKF